MKIQVQTYLHHTTLFLITASNIKYDNFPFLTYSKKKMQNKTSMLHSRKMKLQNSEGSSMTVIKSLLTENIGESRSGRGSPETS